MADWRSILKKHFDGQEGSFQLHLRANRWDRVAFSELVHAMKACCIESCAADTGQLERWVAACFWDAESYARVSLMQPDFKMEHSELYFRKAIELLHDLSYWYFMGESPAGDDMDPELYPLTLPD